MEFSQRTFYPGLECQRLNSLTNTSTIHQAGSDEYQSGRLRHFSGDYVLSPITLEFSFVTTDAFGPFALRSVRS